MVAFKSFPSFDSLAYCFGFNTRPTLPPPNFFLDLDSLSDDCQIETGFRASPKTAGRVTKKSQTAVERNIISSGREKTLCAR